MDLRSYFKSASSSHQSCSTSINSSSSSSETESDKSTECSPPKRHCTSTSKAPVKSSIVRQYNNRGGSRIECRGVLSIPYALARVKFYVLRPLLTSCPHTTCYTKKK